MADIASNGMDQSLAEAFCEQLRTFVDGKRMSPSEAAKSLGVDRQLLNPYFNGKSKEEVIGRKKHTVTAWTQPRLDFIFRVCTRLGFAFKYGDYRILAERLDGTPVPQIESQQLQFAFVREFALPESNGVGAVRVKVNKPSGRIELSVSLKADAS